MLVDIVIFSMMFSAPFLLLVYLNKRNIMCPGLMVALAVLLPALAFGAEPKPGANEKNFLGNWIVVSYTHGGVEQPKEKLDQWLVTVFSDHLTLFTDKGKHEWTFALAAKESPKAIDLTLTEGEHKGQVLRGIYRLDEGAILLAVHMKFPDSQRPKKFESKRGEPVMRIKLERKKE